MVRYGQLVVGPPGSGKTTYCNGMQQFLQDLGRPTSIVNLDPANETMPYKAAVDVQELVSLDDVMDAEHLGPNGGVVYAVEYLNSNFAWLQEKLLPVNDYILFDCPGQGELFTHQNAMKTISEKLQKMGYQFVVVHLVDAQYCTVASHFISVLLLSLRTMLQFEAPHVNVLSKIDTLRRYGSLPFKLDYYTEVQDLSYLLNVLNEETKMQNFQKLNEAVCNLVEDFGLVEFDVLSIEDKLSMAHLLQKLDRATGYATSNYDVGPDLVWAQATRSGWEDPSVVRDVHERWLGSDSEDG